jgi:twitching motility protein PilJ
MISNPSSPTVAVAAQGNARGGADFLSNLRLWQKFTLLGVIALALLSYPLYTVYKLNRETIDTVRTEEAGLPPIKTTEDLIQAFQDHRTTSSYFLNNDATRAAPRAKATTDADEAIANLEKLPELRDDAVVAKRLAAIKEQWATVKSDVEGRRVDSRRTLDAHNALITKSLGLIDDLTAHYLIDLDPEAGAYYAFRASLSDLPQLKEAIRALRSPVTDRLEDIAKVRKTAEQPPAGFNLDASLRDAMRGEDRARFLASIQQAERAAKSYGENMRKAMASSPEMKTELAAQTEQITSLTEQAMQMARRELLTKDLPTIDAATYQRDVSVSRELALKASAGTDKLLSGVLAKRGNEARRATLLTLGGEALLLLIGVTIAYLIVRNITGTVKGLQGSVERVRQGDFNALQAIGAKDEVGDLGRTVNDLLQERIAAQRLAEATNEGLNNSVVSILQAVYQLSQRDLTAKAPVTEDIIGTVSDSINALTDETTRVLHDVTRIANQVESASGKVKVQADLVAKTSDDERTRVGEMIKSLGESSASATQMATLADQSNTSAAQATHATNTALDTVNGTVKGMESIRETIAETEKRIKRLGERSQEITGIVNLINTISERTHVLALNASMQAAVAGEAGRGFAVVAEEVQRLAESSRNATQQIGTLVSNIQLETNETINTVNRTITQVVQGSEQAQRAGEQMRVTQGITAQLVAQVQRIADGSNAQKQVSEQLLLSVQQIGQTNDRTAAQIGVQNLETDSLLASARRLVESVNVFKLPQAA